MPQKASKSSSLRIAVGGLAITYPFGGMFWHYIQFVEGLKQMGHDVVYIEDLGRWCYSPKDATFVENGSANANHFAQQIARVNPDLLDSWMFRDVTGKVYGRAHAATREFCQSADLFLNISISHDVRECYAGANCTVLVDTDPMYTQALLGKSPGGTERDEEAEERRRVLQMLDGHDAFFTYGLNVGAEDCLVPTGGYDWHHLVQPLAMTCFESRRRKPAERRRAFTTIASWEPNEALTQVAGVLYGGKSREFAHIMQLPERAPVPLEIALSGEPPVEQLRENKWKVVDGFQVSSDPWRYQEYLADSLGELSVAKHAYIASRSGWFSDRSACYLALGVPVVLQDTAFSQVLPTGEGLFAFNNADEAMGAIEAITADPERHASAAHAIAQEHFRADLVLGNLLGVASTYV